MMWMKNRFIGVVIVLWWLGMMGSLTYRYILNREVSIEGAPPLDTVALADTWRDTEEWMELRWKGLGVGVMRSTAKAIQITRPDQRPRQAFHATMLISIGWGPFKGRLVASALLNERLNLNQFSLFANLGSPENQIRQQWRLDGVAKRTRLVLRVESDTGEQFQAFKLKRPLALADSLRPLHYRTDLKEGDTYTIPVFDPIWNVKEGIMVVYVAGQETLEINGKEVEALKIETRMDNFQTVTWSDGSGKILKRVIPPLEMIAISEEQALKRHPWLANLPEPPDLDVKVFQTQPTEKPIENLGLFGVFNQRAPETKHLEK